MADQETIQSCAYCGGKLQAITTVQVCHPYPPARDKIDKQYIKAKDVTVTGDELSTTRPFCVNHHCANVGRPLEPARSRTELIQDLMRELISRGMSARDLQKLVGGHVSAIDLLAATYPKGFEADDADEDSP